MVQVSFFIFVFYYGERKFLQYFGNIKHNLAALDAFAKVVKVTNYTGL